MDKLERFLLISLIVIFVLVFLRWLKHFLRRNEIQEQFPYVYPFGKAVLSANEELVIDLPYSDKVQVYVLSLSGAVVITLPENKLKPGKHRITLDLSEIPPGEYELKVSFTNQLTRRAIRIG